MQQKKKRKNDQAKKWKQKKKNHETISLQKWSFQTAWLINFAQGQMRSTNGKRTIKLDMTKILNFPSLSGTGSPIQLQLKTPREADHLIKHQWSLFSEIASPINHWMEVIPSNFFKTY